MSDDVDHIAPEDEGRALAAEYVLGVLSAEERRKVETRMAEEASFAREVAEWEERLGGMASYIPPVTPPAQTWLRIEASLGPAPAGAAAQPSMWQSLAFWRAVSIGTSTLAAACLAALVYIGTQPPTQAPRTPLLATLTGLKTNQPNFVATIGADGSTLTIVPAALLTADKRSMELWLIPQGGKPASLGLIARRPAGAAQHAARAAAARGHAARRSRCRSNRPAARRPASPPARSSPTAIYATCDACCIACSQGGSALRVYARHNSDHAAGRLSMTGLRSIVLASAFALAARQAPAAAQAPPAITGQVTSAEEGPMEGVLVTARRDGAQFAVSVSTNERGIYAFPESRLAPGTYSLQIRAVGYELERPATTDVAAARTATLELKLRKTSDLSMQLTSTEWFMSWPGTEAQKEAVYSCTNCHSVDRIARSRHNAEEWLQVFVRMASYANMTTDAHSRSASPRPIPAASAPRSRTSPPISPP